MFKTLLASLAVLATTMPSLAQSNHSHHQSLVEAVKKTGVTVYINPEQVCNPKTTGKGKFFGFYAGADQLMVICQEEALNRGVFNTQYDWTEEDYDTLRHESHHLVQDCRDKSLNAKLHTVYTKPLAFAGGVLSKRRFSWVVETYGDRGNEMVVLELEAFSVAQLNDPLEQIDDIKRYCM
jgi:hypothetical protein